MLPLATYTKRIPCRNTIIMRNGTSCSSFLANGATYTSNLRIPVAVVFVNDRVVERLKAITVNVVTIIEDFVDARGNELS